MEIRFLKAGWNLFLWLMFILNIIGRFFSTKQNYLRNATYITLLTMETVWLKGVYFIQTMLLISSHF